MTGTKLHTFPKDAFSNLRILRSLDLRNNAIEEISITIFDVPAIKHIYLAGKHNFFKFLLKNCKHYKLFVKI